MHEIRPCQLVRWVVFVRLLYADFCSTLYTLHFWLKSYASHKPYMREIAVLL